MPGPQRGDIYFTDVEHGEHIGREFFGPHWYLVVSINAINNFEEIVIAVPLTSPNTDSGEPKDKGDFRFFHIRIPEREKLKDSNDGVCVGDSIALTEQIRVMSVRRFQQPRAAHISDAAMAAVECGIAFVLRIPISPKAPRTDPPQRRLIPGTPK